MRKLRIDIQKQLNVTSILFPDNQPHVRISENIGPGDSITVLAPIRSSLELFRLMLVSNALDNAGAHKEELCIPYLMGARYDRIMQPGDSLDLQVVCDTINTMGFSKVWLFDVHNPTKTLGWIHRSHNLTNEFLVRKYDKPNAVLICPDAGAESKVQSYWDWNQNIVDVVYCTKSRDLNDKGKVNLTVLNPEKCEGRNCIIIDDLCDGGATFMAIAEQIRPQHLTLMVSHGIFSKGFNKLEQCFDEIITTDSFERHNQADVTTYNIYTPLKAQ